MGSEHTNQIPDVTLAELFSHETSERVNDERTVSSRVIERCGVHVTSLSLDSKLFLSTSGLLGTPSNIFLRWLNNG